jgi:hypothetical protein
MHAMPLTALVMASSAIASPCLEGSASPTDATVYAFDHKIMVAVEGVTVVQDTVRLWSQTSRALCFAIDTVHTNLHVCELSGEAKLVGPDLYRYEDGSCKVEISIGPRRVVLRAIDPRQPGSTMCQPHETSQRVCGANTAISSGTFVERK